ncbi:MAG: tannase/feruloyl esterase family alpha/beta hydrolase [Vicinamibacterales bacterium]
MKYVLSGSVVALGLAGTLVAQGTAPTPASCDALARLALPDTSITATEQVPGPTFTPPGGREIRNLPGFCRVAATSRPAVRFEVWLPAANWNGRFQGVGNGANAGSISFDAMAAALRRGYAVASTDTGHQTTNGRDARWALGHPELLEDFAHRGLHLMTVQAKQVVRSFYGQPASRSYYVGCSTGGRQGLMEAQRYPEDYDGLVAGAPAANWTRFQTGGHLWAVLALNKDPESYIPTSRLPIIEKAVNAACDALDGVTDGVLNDPRQCRFDANTLTCRAGQDPSTCLTPKQADAVNQIWTGPRDSRGQLVYPPYMRGAEAAGGWATYTTGSGPLSGSHWEQATNTLKYMVFENPEWDFRTFDYDRDVAFADRKLGAIINAFDPDLSGLRRRGGRLLLYHGWNDPSISPQNTVNYYDSAVARWREQEKPPAGTAPDFIRLFMVPGMLHCSGGPGADTFDPLTALERWVERSEMPEVLTASKVVNGTPVRTRPLCAYPKVAVYNGSGSTDDAASFSCRNPS